MKRFTTIAFALLLFSGTASAQANLPEGGLLGNLVGQDGVLFSLMPSAQQQSLQPTFDATAGDSGLVQGSGANSLSQVLTALLAQPYFEGQNASDGLTTFLINGPNGGLIGGLSRALTGSGDFAGSSPLSSGDFGGFSGLLGGGTVTGDGQGLSPDQIPLQNVDPGTQSALSNNVTLLGL